MNANQQLIARAIERGLVRVGPNLSTEAYINRQVREAYYARGLTATGRKPAKRKLPQFATLTSRQYHRAYMRQWREERKGR